MAKTAETTAFPAILASLIEAQGRALTFEELELKTGQPRTVINAGLKHFNESGIQLRQGAEGIALVSLPDVLLPDVLRAGLKSRFMGAEIHSYKSLGSTNEAAERLAEAGAVEGTLVTAERQTRGRGRLGRTWHSPSGQGLYFSLILRPRVSLVKMPALSMVAALSVCRAIESQIDQETQIKWPNDCLLGGKKVSGILVELSAEIDMVCYAVLGIGINVNNRARDFPSKLRSRATSLALASGQQVDRAALLRYFLADFEKSYNNFHRYGLRFLGPELVKRSAVIGKKITVTQGKRKLEGVVLGYDQNGALRMRAKEGVKVIAAGEVTLR